MEHESRDRIECTWTDGNRINHNKFEYMLGWTMDAFGVVAPFSWVAADIAEFISTAQNIVVD